MSACGAVSSSHEVEFHALEGSLNMMSKVLNDVLDLCVNRDHAFFPSLIGRCSHRMDSGRFESFNKVLHTLAQSSCSKFSSPFATSPTFSIKSWNRSSHLYGSIPIPAG